jgi:hypothetical protein
MSVYKKCNFFSFLKTGNILPPENMKKYEHRFIPVPPAPHGVVYLIQHSMIKFVSDLQQVGGFLRLFQFPPTIKLTIKI